MKPGEKKGGGDNSTGKYYDELCTDQQESFLQVAKNFPCSCPKDVFRFSQAGYIYG